MAHYCTIHNTEFYKHEKDGKVWYSHPVQENGEDVKGRNGKTMWCNEDIKEAVNALPRQEPGKPLPEHQDEIDKSRASVRPEPSGQEIGLWWKEMGEGLRSKYITDPLLKLAYFAQMFNVLDIKGVKIETNKADSKTETGNEVSEDEGTQTVLDEGERELKLSYVRALLDRNGIDKKGWFSNMRRSFEIAKTKTTDIEIWGSLDDSQKRLAIGGLK